MNNNKSLIPMYVSDCFYVWLGVSAVHGRDLPGDPLAQSLPHWGGRHLHHHLHHRDPQIRLVGEHKL